MRGAAAIGCPQQRHIRRFMHHNENWVSAAAANTALHSRRIGYPLSCSYRVPKQNCPRLRDFCDWNSEIVSFHEEHWKTWYPRPIPAAFTPRWCPPSPPTSAQSLPAIVLTDCSRCGLTLSSELSFSNSLLAFPDINLRHSGPPRSMLNSNDVSQFHCVLSLFGCEHLNG